METKKNTLIIILTILLILNICATIVIGILALGRNTDAPADGTSQFVMYVGTNDKDTYEQIIPTDEAKDIIDRICFKYLEGYTIQDATGSWVDDQGLATHENTIVCYFDDADRDTVYKVADEIIAALNQNSVLIENDTIQIDFYSGAN